MDRLAADLESLERRAERIAEEASQLESGIDSLEQLRADAEERLLSILGDDAEAAIGAGPGRSEGLRSLLRSRRGLLSILDRLETQFGVGGSLRNAPSAAGLPGPSTARTHTGARAGAGAGAGAGPSALLPAVPPAAGSSGAGPSGGGGSSSGAGVPAGVGASGVRPVKAVGKARSPSLEERPLVPLESLKALVRLLRLAQVRARCCLHVPRHVLQVARSKP